MKMQSFKILAAVLVLTITSTFAIANTERRDAFNIEVPFQFQVGDRVFEAGKYQVFRDDQSKIVIENRQSGRQHFYLGVFDGNYKLGETIHTLRFHKYGDTHFLRQVTARGAEFNMPRTRAEKRAKKSYGKGASMVMLGTE